MEDQCQLYLISPSIISDLTQFLADFEGAVSGGDVACFQLRLKSSDGIAAADDAILKAADKLLPIAQKHDVAFLINDSPELAQKCGADGVHIGQQDTDLKSARALLGDEASIGVTCHNSIHLAMEAGEGGADYVAFGAFFPTETKMALFEAETDLLQRWREMTIVPSVAIGGISPENCKPLVVSGADFIAASGAVWGHKQGPAQAVLDFRDAFTVSA